MRKAAIAMLILGTALSSGSAWAQTTVLVLETTFEGDISAAVAQQFRDALQRGLAQGEGYTVIGEAGTRTQLGSQADRLMHCGSDSACLADLGRATGADAAIVAAVGDAAEIYAYTVDVYDLSTGEGVFFTDDDCALCTLDEAAAAFERLGVEAADALETLGAEPTPPAQVVRAETITLFIRAEPASARIWLNGEPLGAGVAEAAVGPGSYTLSVSADGYAAVEDTIVVAAGDDDKVVNVRLRELDAQTPPGAVAGRSGGALDGVNTTVLGSVLVGTGLASLVTGIVLLAIDGETTCSDGAVTECPEVYETTAGGTVLTVLGAAAVSGGVIFLLWETLAGPPAPAQPATASGSARVHVGFDGQSGFLGLGGRF